MVSAQRKALEMLWEDSCAVYKSVKDRSADTGETMQTFVPVFENVKCKLCFGSLLTAPINGDHVAEVIQITKLILGNEHDIPPGCRIKVLRTHGDGSNTVHYFKASGKPGIFTVHQEIQLEIAERWA